MPAPIYQGNAGYTPISTIGTQTINGGPLQVTGGQALPVGQIYGVLYGYNAVSTGTASMQLTYLDIYTTISGTGTITTTQTLASFASPAAGASSPAGIQGVGIRYRGALVLVTTGTAGAGNTLWD